MTKLLRLFSLLAATLFSLWLLPLEGQAQGGTAKAPQAEIRIIPNRTDYLAGDSTTFSVVIVSTFPVAQATCNDDVSIKGKKRLPFRTIVFDRNRTASRIMENGQIKYTLVWTQFVVRNEAAGTYTIAPLHFNLDLQERIGSDDPFDFFFGRRQQSRTHKVKASSEKLTFTFQERPLRSTQEMLNDSKVV